ncbi:hypothetical protein CY34DRAFT_282628 [Suillus luteus UH-Slu-Lm8-n1]|uniref:DUF6533 domain-containing protein n=1 Tax=Suillus luteus UH-Slu-Lm8-n1 TaxID=930992 RepID=A0A0D0B121_9AGAM|nr:hypothetical protein CY34DRAFT_282628 [Suillus luteus UH-Slu-Lm8-n1]
MTIVSNDPSWWPLIDSRLVYSYWIGLSYQSVTSRFNIDLHFAVAAGVVVVYDWVLTLGQEIELIWRQRWSLMTVLYLIIRYSGIPYSIATILPSIPLVSLTDAVSNTLYHVVIWTTVVLYGMLGVIMIARLHAMYQRSRIMLIFLVIIFLAVNITCGVLTVIALSYIVIEEMILSGTYMCGYEFEGDVLLLTAMNWTLFIVWEVLALCLSVWIAVKHFRDLRRLGPSTGSTIGDCFRALIKSHVLYFAIFTGVSSLQLVNVSPVISNSDSTGTLILQGVVVVSLTAQLFVLGPRLILSVREHNAKLVADSDAETSMNSIVFQELVHVPTSSAV